MRFAALHACIFSIPPTRDTAIFGSPRLHTPALCGLRALNNAVPSLRCAPHTTCAFCHTCLLPCTCTLHARTGSFAAAFCTVCFTLRIHLCGTVAYLSYACNLLYLPLFTCMLLAPPCCPLPPASRSPSNRPSIFSWVQQSTAISGAVHLHLAYRHMPTPALLLCRYDGARTLANFSILQYCSLPLLSTNEHYRRDGDVKINNGA